MSIQESLRIVERGDVALMEWDLVGEKVNKLSSPIMTRFDELLDQIARSSYKAVILISRKPSIFIAGADINEIQTFKNQEAFVGGASSGQKIINKMEEIPIPFIAAIHGAALGGGCEIALACDYRMATSDNATRIGLPETRLGIIPGFGGCVRLPRIVGLQASLDIILAGKAVDGKKALKMGLIDELVPLENLEEYALRLAQEIKSRGKRKKYFKPKKTLDRFLESMVGRQVVFNQAKKTLMKQTMGHYPAPLKALEVIKSTYGMRNLNRSLDIEAKGFGEVAVTDVSKNLINLFFMMEGVKKQNGVKDPSVQPLPVQRLGVLGAGVMGGGIAYAAADKGIDVRMKDIQLGAIGTGLKAAYVLWDKKVKKRRMTPKQRDRKMALISGGIDFSGFENLDLVVEAVVEDMGIKQKVIGDTAGHCRSNCIIATNTSSLSVTEMSKGHPHPENFVGMHFFNPVDKMPLVEVIRGEKTSDVATATVFEVAKKMGKTPVVVKDGPGFLVNRLLLPYLGEAAFLLGEGMSIESLDRFYKEEFGMPMGPCRLLDEVGIDVAIKVLKIFKKALGNRAEISPLLSQLEGTDRLGKKGGKGFYLYDENGKEKQVDHSIYKELGLAEPKDPLTSRECLERGIFSMINEATLVLVEEQIVSSAEELDLAMIMGTGFPPFRGGLLRYADSVGTEYIVDELEMYSSRYGARFKPCNPLRNMAKTKRTFY